MKLKVERMNHTGEGIAIKDKLIYFIPKTIPGDIIEVEENNIINYKTYNKVINYNIIEKSNKREEELCPYYKECGGCQIMSLPYKEQLLYKQEKVKNIFKKYANTDINPIIIETTQYKYRNKITLQVKDGILGLYKENTHDIIPITKCLLIPDKLNTLINDLKEINLQNINKIVLKNIKDKIMIQLIGNPNKEEIIKKLSTKASSLYINDTLIKGLPFLTEELSQYKYNISPNSFFQINKEGTITIYNIIKEYLGKNNNHVLDLYCGTGSIGIYISNNCKEITGIELNKSATEDAKKNVKLNNLTNIKIINGSVNQLLKDNQKYDAIIVDPPRSGLDKKTKEILLKIKSKKIIYISCNPITLARDINTLNKEYQLQKITLVDMFPNTYHVESVLLLNLKTMK